MTKVFILYDWNSNTILSTPITDAKNETIVKSFKDNVNYLNIRGFKAKLNMIDNAASKLVQAYLEAKNIGI